MIETPCIVYPRTCHYKSAGGKSRDPEMKECRNKDREEGERTHKTDHKKSVPKKCQISVPKKCQQSVKSVK